MARLVAVPLTLLTVPVLGAASAAANATLEYQVKAAFVLNFTRFVEWPDEQPPPASFVVCLLTHDPFDGALHATLAGETWRDVPFEVRQLSASEAPRGCHLLYVPRDDTEAFARLAAGGLPPGLLTVGEAAGFLPAGGIINLVLDANRVRFEVDLDAAERARLKISSRLLHLARDVRRARGP